ncbi:tRNA pseudouridine(38-40) synthase TruA [Caloramator sp. CAR-1]|uniref:tRNA pseudouridine(38-40) synthase TruA n=1 Tax=Caloramator sp. CAR-1 TaxID=3062777 RepID=UPI0026E29797|nr:tRNA pseudouridine(38-40) synthase TruA [Caloramator sp. CAR-1]MDO6353760.1 tRNA pseudouridine(38-40) synthase TruA [Caloramator sp. CAR-1]
MKNIKIVIEYDGTRYCGWQRQKNGVSIQETIEKAIEKVTGEKIEIIGSSRTDAGVHAKGQVANFLTSSTVPPEKICYAINSFLPDDIVILSSQEVPLDFHSRYNSKGKKYSYTILNRKIPSALLKNYSAHIPYELNIEDMIRASKYFLGEHDFSAFKSTGSSVKGNVRTIKRLELIKDEDIIKMFIEANGFLYNMVRIIAGTLIEVGKGRIKPDDIPFILDSRDRKKAGPTAPAQGLCLEKVYY